MSDTLPPGWRGNDADHHAVAGPVRLRVYRDRKYNPFAQQHQRTGGYRWVAALDSSRGGHASATAGEPTADAARKAAILAARVIAYEIAQGCDWLTAPPVASEVSDV